MKVKSLLAGTVTAMLLLSGCRQMKVTNIDTERDTFFYTTDFATEKSMADENTQSNELANQAGNEQTNIQREKEQKLVLKVYVNLGMEEEFDVLAMDDHTVTYSYYNYENTDTPQLDQKTVSFDELMKKEYDERVYLFKMYLGDGTEEIHINMSEDFIQQLENIQNLECSLEKY